MAHTNTHALPNTHIFPGYCQRVPLSYHLTRDHPLSFSSTSSKEASLLFIRGHRHAYVSNTKCVVCASQPPLCVRLHPGNQSNLLDTLKRARSSKAALYRWKIKYSSEGENAKDGTRWCLVKFDVPQKSYRYLCCGVIYKGDSSTWTWALLDIKNTFVDPKEKKFVIFLSSHGYRINSRLL